LETHRRVQEREEEEQNKVEERVVVKHDTFFLEKREARNQSHITAESVKEIQEKA